MAASDLASGDQTIWTEATEFLSDVCRELDAGELVHGENFSLFESMSALEIMDPKMDGGMNTGGPKTVEEAISMGMAPIDLTLPQMIDVMDHIFSCEASWHTGHSLAQTVFSNIYMLKLECAVSMPLLYSFCKLTRVTCRMVRTTVFQSHTHEEEDAFAFAFGLPLDMNDSDCLAVLNAAEEVYSKKMRKAKSAIDVQLQQQSEEQYYSCALSRLRFRKALYQALIHMEKPQGRGLETARKHLSTARSELSAIRGSSEFLASQHVQERSVTTASGRRAFGFDENLNRTLLPPTPPRSMKLLEWTETLDCFQRLLRDLDRVSLVPLSPDFESLQELIVHFQKSNPDLIARAHMQLLVLQGGKLFGLWPMSDVVYKSIYSHSGPVPQDTRLERFLQQAGWLAISLLRILCAHPAWQCRKLGKALEEWSNLFEQVELLEDPSRETPAVNWLACQSSWIAFRYLWLGFELELYSSDEYSMVYWYLDHVLLTLLHYKSEREESTRSDNTQKKKSKKKRAGGAKDIVKPAKSAKDSPMHPELILMQCFSDLCKVNIWMLAAFKKDDKLDRRTTEFTTEQERYLQRFELLHKILVPCPLSFQNFREATSFERYSSAVDLYRLSYEHLTSVELTLERLGSRTGITELSQEISQLQQVVARNRVALQIIDKAGQGDGLKASFQFLHHPCFGVVAIKNSYK